MHGHSRMPLAIGKENMDIRVHRVRKKFLDLDRHQRLSRLLLLLLRSDHHRCPVDLACTRQVPHRHMVLLHSRRHRRTQRELHRIQIHKLVD